MTETAYNQTNESKTAQLTTSEHTWITRILKLAEQRPDEVQIIHHPDDNYGYLLANVPKSWFKVSPPKTRTMSEEQKAALVERLQKSRQKDT